MLNSLDNQLTQQYCCVMIPDLEILAGAAWKVLPPGVHSATLSEIDMEFATNRVRRDLFAGLKLAAKALHAAGCRAIYVDGSFVTGKPSPNDYDVCRDPSGVDPARLDPVFLDFSNNRANQKAKYLGEFFPFSAAAAPGKTFLDFFQTDRFTGAKKGLLVTDLTTETF